MSQEAVAAAAKFVQGKPGNSPRVHIGIHNTPSDYGSRLLNDGERIYSYGLHFLIAWRDVTLGGFWVTEGKYRTGEWKSGKPKYSPTTAMHVREVTYAVAAIADATEQLSEWHSPDGNTYRFRFYRSREPMKRSPGA